MSQKFKKFKVGDRVRVVNLPREPSYFQQQILGGVGEILVVDADYCMCVVKFTSRQDPLWMLDYNLELFLTRESMFDESE